ncbi:integrase catalytic domain-containing protein [Trichonephila clavipes]|nr:integrase catalytic domain-containing protein [Trichonephila clavipes]
MTASALASSVKSSETEIGLLIGADNIGKLLTGNLIQFDLGLTAIETKLGWTVIEKQWEDLNIIERVPEVELNNECHYLPHRPVIKLDSATTKIRSVFDASAREKGKPSLNDCLYKGVNLIELIPDILDRFRIYPVGIVADIEKAFLMLSVAPKDRDYLRFFSHAMKNN